MIFNVPVTGWLEVEAVDLAAAQEVAKQLNENGVPLLQIEDSTTESECLIDEIEPAN